MANESVALSINIWLMFSPTSTLAYFLLVWFGLLYCLCCAATFDCSFQIVACGVEPSERDHEFRCQLANHQLLTLTRSFCSPCLPFLGDTFSQRIDGAISIHPHCCLRAFAENLD